MAMCEKCWADAGGIAEKYFQLLHERKDNPCTLEDQAGPAAGLCTKCNRKTIHQYAQFCLICGPRTLDKKEGV